MSLGKQSVDNRIVVKFVGGLGNQLFDYVFYEWIKKEFPEKRVLADLTDYKIHMPHYSLGIWDVFPKVGIEKAGFRDLYEITGEIPVFYGGPLKNKLNTLRKGVNARFYCKSDRIYKNDGDWVSPDFIKKAISEGYNYLDSYWQDAEFFISTREITDSVFAFSVSDVVEYEEDLKKSNAVSMHVRRGDYVGSVFDKEVNEEYYKKAVEYVSSKVDNPHFYIFSDDLDYVEKTYSWIENKTLVKGFSGKQSYIDMYLMSLTPNSIIANSTFSLWAAYLNCNSNPLIVYPDVPYMEHKRLPHWSGLI